MQTGADIAGLEAAKDCGFETGGTAAAKFQQSISGNKKIYSPNIAKEFNLKEGAVTIKKSRYGGTYLDVYYQRTIDNAQEADGTIWFGNHHSPGGKLTLGKTTQKNKVTPLINPKSASEIIGWIKENNIEVVNIAGNREHSNPGIYNHTKALLIEAFNLIKNEQ